MELTNLKGALEAIRLGQINCGLNQDYCFVTNEDGELVFLKRNRRVDQDIDGEPTEQWPTSYLDGEALFRHDTLENRGTRIAELFLEAIGIDYLG